MFKIIQKELWRMILSNKTKDLMKIVINDNMYLVPIMHQLSHYTYRDGILNWLIDNRLVGYNLLDWLKINHDNSVLGMVKFIIKHHNKSLEEKEIRINRDWIK